MPRKLLVIILLCLASSTIPVLAHSEISATLIDFLNVRSGPGADQTVLTMLPARSTVIVEGRNRIGNWLLVHTPDSATRGWVATRYVILPDSVELGSLPVVQVQITAPTTSAPQDGGAPAPNEPTGKAITLLNVRSAPGRQSPAMATMPRNTIVILEGRSKAGDWVLVHSLDNTVRGWVATRYLILPDDFDLGLLPITEQQVSAAAPTANDDSGQVGEWEAFLNNVPVIPTISDHVRQIYRQGLQMGNHAHVIAKIGDCNTENYAFLSPLDSGNEDLGPYSNLQPAVEYFKGSFSLDSVAGRTGYSALTVLDSTWADPRVCQPGESSAYCEIRRRHASVAIIMFGSNDIFTLTADQYESSIRQIIEMSIAHGTIPILTTATNRRELGNKWATLLQFNVITVNLARQYDVPVINFWLAAQSLPGGGISSDLAHLTYSGSPRVSFNGEEKIAGFSLRNLVTLQALEAVRQAVAGS